jgi:hypothetical protein
LQDTRLRLEWEARGRYGGGAPPPPGVERAAGATTAGLCEVDLTSGTVAPLSAEDEDPRAHCCRPPLLPNDVGEPWCAGSAVARLVWEGDGAEHALVLEVRRSSAIEPVDRVPLARGRGLVAQVTPDGCHVLVHQEPARAGDDAWRVFAATSGVKVATVTHDAGAGWPAVIGRRLFYVVQQTEGTVRRRALRARELASDALAWELSLGERTISAAPQLRP